MTAVHAIVCDTPIEDAQTCQGYILRPPDATLPVWGYAQSQGWTIGDGKGPAHPDGAPRPEGMNTCPACARGVPLYERGCPRCGGPGAHHRLGYRCVHCAFVIEEPVDDDGWDLDGEGDQA